MFKIIVTLLFGMGIFGCANNPVYTPENPTKEYQQPFPFAKYQAQQLEETEMVIAQQSDVVDVESSSQHVIWTKTPPAAPPVTEPQPIESKVAVKVVQAETVVEKVEEVQLVEAISPRCMPLYCDKENEYLCGKVSMCGDDFCRKSDATYYTCDAQKCVTKYAGKEVVYAFECSADYMAIHPSCLGKGDLGCEGHWDNLKYCNPRLTLCSEEDK